MRRILVVLCLLGAVAPVAVAEASSAVAVASFEARGSVEQVYTTGHAPGGPVELLDGAGAVVQSAVADAAGARLFRAVAAGTGYQVRGNAGAVVGPLTVTAFGDNPADSFYTQTVAADPLEVGYGYLTTRDGTTLSANVTFPVDGSTGPWPVLVNYSGYDPSQPGGPPQESLVYTLQGYVVVGVNMRGTGCSGGSFDFFENLQSTDGYDVIETLAHQPWSNGDVGMVGISYPGYSQLYVAATRPPHLDAITPLSPYSDTYSGILRPGGILNEGFATEWAIEREANAKPLARPWARARVAAGDTVCANNQVLRLQANPLLTRILGTPFADHEFDYLNTETFVDQIQVPTFLSSQWQDEQTGGSAANLIPLFNPTTKVFANFTNGTHVEPMSPSEIYEAMVFVDLYVGHRVPRINPVLTAAVPAVLADLFQASSQAASFTMPVSDWDTTGTYAAAVARYESQPRVRIRWENGSIPGKEGLPIAPVTTRHANWPVDGTINEKLYLQPDGALGSQAPDLPDTAARAASSYIYDAGTKRARTSDKGTSSQWAPHPDVHWNPLAEGNSLSFLTPAYPTQVAYAGQGSADLWLRSSAADTDLEVTLTEVRPDGKEVFIQSGWLRASHRKEELARSTELVPYQDHQEVDAAPLPAGEFSKVRVEMFPFAHVIRAGSRLRVNVEAPGGNQPFWAFDALPGTSVNDIGHSAGLPSRIVLPKLPAAESPVVAAAFPACSLPGVTTQSVSSRNEPCRPYLPARVATAVTASADYQNVTVRWVAPSGPAPTAYRIVPSVGAGAAAGATAPAPIEVGGTALDGLFSWAPAGVPLEFRVVAVYGAATAPASDASLPVTARSRELELFGSWAAFARRQLNDFTGSAPAGLLSSDVARLEAGLTPDAYVAGIRRGADAVANVDPIVRLHLALFDRTPTAQELQYWLAKRRSGWSLEKIAQRLVDSREFRDTYGRLSNRAFVEFVFAKLGTVAPNPLHVDYWTAILDLKLRTRGQLMLLYPEGEPFKVSAGPQVDTAAVWIAMLGRAPSATELSATAARLQSGTPLATIVGEILASPAYAARIRR